jgi:hypothetical protein
MEWRVSPSFPEYEVSEYGDVRRCVMGGRGHAFGFPLRHKLVNGYKWFPLSLEGKRYYPRASRLVAEAFIGPPPFDGAQVCHGDRDRTNNYYRNLRWDSSFGNQADRVKHGTHTRGEHNSQSKLTATVVMEMRRCFGEGVKRKAIAARFGVAYPTVAKIVLGQRWTHLPDVVASFSHCDAA